MSARQKKAQIAPVDIGIAALRASSQPREMELIGCDEDGNMSLWSTGMVQPVSKFELVDGDQYIESGHYVIEWKGHAVTVHCGSYADGWVSVQFMCSDCYKIRMHRLEVEEMLIGKVLPDPAAEARTIEAFKLLTEIYAARRRAPHRQRGRI